MINSPPNNDLKLKHHKFVMVTCIRFVPKVKRRYEVYSAMKLYVFLTFDMDFASRC